MYQALTIIFGHIFLILLLSWFCFQSYRLNRPPIGVMNLLDVAFMLVVIVLIPVLYMLLPTGVMIATLTIAAASGLYLLLEAVLPNRLLTWLVLLILIAADLWTLNFFGAGSTPFFAVNNVIQVLVIVSVTNLWAQSGMKANALAILGLALMVYDLVFTSLLPFMGDMFAQLPYVPFSPMIAWNTGAGEQWLGIGFGDLALAAVFPLVMRKAYTRQAGLMALAGAVCAFAAGVGLTFTGLVGETFPLMVLLGPLMAGQYLYWRSRQGEERTMRAFLEAELEN